MKLPATLKSESICVAVDSREQQPWNLAPLQTESGTLQTGDYALAGDGWRDLIRIERKSLADLIGVNPTAQTVARHSSPMLAIFPRQSLASVGQHLLRAPRRKLLQSTPGRIHIASAWREAAGSQSRKASKPCGTDSLPAMHRRTPHSRFRRIDPGLRVSALTHKPCFPAERSSLASMQRPRMSESPSRLLSCGSCPDAMIPSVNDNACIPTGAFHAGDQDETLRVVVGQNMSCTISWRVLQKHSWSSLLSHLGNFTPPNNPHQLLR